MTSQVLVNDQKIGHRGVNMRIKDMVRIGVIKSNHYWSFSSTNKIPYYLAVKAFIQQCKKFPEIKSVYLKHSFTEGNWFSRLSDIDWTIVIDNNLNTDT